MHFLAEQVDSTIFLHNNRLLKTRREKVNGVSPLIITKLQDADFRWSPFLAMQENAQSIRALDSLSYKQSRMSKELLDSACYTHQSNERRSVKIKNEQRKGKSMKSRFFRFL